LYWVNVRVIWGGNERVIKALRYARVPVAGDQIELMPKVFALVSSVVLYSHLVDSGPVALADVDAHTIQDYASRGSAHFLKNGWDLTK